MQEVSGVYNFLIIENGFAKRFRGCRETGRGLEPLFVRLAEDLIHTPSIISI